MNLVPLYEEAIQFNNFNGTVLAAGKVEVWYLGRTRKADIYADVAGETPLPNPFDLNDLGMQEVYVNPAFNYTLVVYDPYGSELFSVDKYLQGAGAHTTSNVVVQPSEHIGVSAWTVGEVQIYQPYLVGEVGKTYEGILPIVVNNDVNRISAQHIPLGVQDPLYFVEDSETACIIGFSGQTEIPSALSSKWDNAADTVIANSAQWAEGTEYEAGSYIDIDGHTISVTGLQPEGDYAYNSALSSKLDVTATGQFLTGLPEDLMYSGDMTAYQPAGDYQTAGDYLSASDSANFLLTGDSGNFYPMEGNPSGFLTSHQSLAGYATEQWVDSQGYLTAVDIPESAVWNATTQTVSANSAQWAGGTANPQIPVTSTSGISIFESGDKVYFNISADYAFTSDLQNVSAEITGMIPAPFDPSYLSGQIDTKLDSAIYANDSGTFLTAHQSLADYQTIAGMTAYQEAGNYLSANALDSLSGNWETVTAKLDTTAFSDVSGTFLTAHQDISNKLDTTAFSDVSGSFLTAVPDTYLQNTDLTIVDNKITEISGVPLSAGDELPSGTMNTSGLEYNAVNEISGYNGSAIAQYGAEKQWLQHDGTLCHLSNSAQYALGVNLSAVAQLLGVDETVLWEGAINTTAQTGQFSEMPHNFRILRTITLPDASGQRPAQINDFDLTWNIDRNTLYAQWQTYNIGANTYSGQTWYLSGCTDGSLGFNLLAGIKQVNGTVTTGLTAYQGTLRKIIGIGRKQ